MSLRRAHLSSGWVLPTVARRCVWSRKPRERGGHSPHWAAEPEKKNNSTLLINTQGDDITTVSSLDLYIFVRNNKCLKGQELKNELSLMSGSRKPFTNRYCVKPRRLLLCCLSGHQFRMKGNVDYVSVIGFCALSAGKQLRQFRWCYSPSKRRVFTTRHGVTHGEAWFIWSESLWETYNSQEHSCLELVTSLNVCNISVHSENMWRKNWTSDTLLIPISLNTLSQGFHGHRGLNLDTLAKLRNEFIFIISVRLSVWNNSAPTGRIFIKFYIWVFFENRWEY
jgi:hypothetical protein